MAESPYAGSTFSHVAKRSEERSLHAVFVDSDGIPYAMTKKGLKDTILANTSESGFSKNKVYNQQLAAAWSAMNNPPSWEEIPELSFQIPNKFL